MASYPQPVFLCEGLRTPIGRYGGALSSVRPDDLLAHVLREVVRITPQCDFQAVEDSFIGCANQAGEDNRNIARMSVLLAGLPKEVPGVTLNRLCGSGLEAVTQGMRAIALGEMEMVLAGGVESMSRSPYVMAKAGKGFDRGQQMEDTTMGWRFVNAALKAQYGTDSMPETAENIAEDYGISRLDQDSYTLRSQRLARAAQDSGRLDTEITPVQIIGAKGAETWVARDEHPRETSAEKLAGLPTPFRQNGTVTAGNASGINDGAAAMILASAEAVKTHGLTPKARIVGAAVAGITPRIMGMGPVPATQKLLQRLGWSLDDLDLIELNEAFAAQALGVLRRLELADNDPRVNPHGGAIALGHPLGMSGARIALSAAISLQQTTASRALCTMCIGVGQGIALALEAV